LGGVAGSAAGGWADADAAASTMTVVPIPIAGPDARVRFIMIGS
jgi:hypothetical protein